MIIPVPKVLEDTATRTCYEQTLLQKLVLTAADKALKPGYWIPTPLFQSLRNCLKEHLKISTGMTYVYSSPRRTGKTTAALAALELSLKVSSDKAPCLYVDAGSFLRVSFRKVLGVPDSMDDKDAVTCMCSQLKPVTEGLPTSPGTYSNSLQQPPPCIVIDHVRSFSSSDCVFIDLLYKVCYSSRILVFIFTDRDDLAHMVCGMNGKARIQPLVGMFRIEDGMADWDLVSDCTVITGQMATGIDWETQLWTKQKLSKIVKNRYSDFSWVKFEDGTGMLNFVQDGDLPDAAMSHAARVIADSAVPEFKKALGIYDNPEYNDYLQ